MLFYWGLIQIQISVEGAGDDGAGDDGVDGEGDEVSEFIVKRSDDGRPLFFPTTVV